MKIQQFTNEVQEFWYNLISSDTVKAIIDAGTKIINFIGNLVDQFGELGTIGTLVAGGFGLNKLYRNFFKKGEETTLFDDVVDNFIKLFSKDNLSKALDGITNAPSLNDFISGLFSHSDKSRNNNPLINTVATEVNSAAIRDNSAAKAENTALTEGSIAVTETDTVTKVGNTAATEGAAAANGLFAKSLTALKAAAPYLLAIAGAIAAVAAIVKIVDDAIVTSAEANEKFENSKSAYENTKSELESLNSELDKTKEKIEELEALDKLTVTEKDELKILQSQRKELEKQIDLKEKLAKKQQEKTAEDAYNAINHSQIEQKETATGTQPVRYDGKVSKISAEIEKYQAALTQQKQLEEKLAGKDSTTYDDMKWYQKLIYDDPYKKVSDELDVAKKDSGELFDSINADIAELQEQRAALFDENGNLIDESYRITADAIERLIIQFSNAGDEAADNELKLFDTFHPEQIADKISKIDDSLEITQDNLGATEEDFLKLEKQGVLSVEYITEKFPNIATAARAAGLPLQELVDHFKALNREAAEAGSSGSKGLYSIKDIVDDANSAFNKAKTAQETENMGATYDAMREQYKTAKELLKKGDIGTDDFKQIAAMFSPTGATDPKNFEENAGKIKRYFTEDNTGVLNFLNDLKKHNLAKYNKETKEWSYSIGDLREAAKKLGIGFEPMMAIFGELNDKGFYNDFFSTTEDGTAHLLDLQEQLQTAEEELQNLYATDPKNSTAIQAKIDEIDTLKQRITKTTDALAELINEDPEKKLEERKKKKKQLKTAIESYNANYEKLKGTEDGRAVLDEWKAEIEQYVAENGFSLEVDVNGKLKIGNVKEASEEAEEESKENPVKVTGVTDKYRVSHTKTFYDGKDNTTTTLLNKNKAMNLGMTEDDMEKYNQKYLKTGKDSKGLIEKTFYGEDSVANAAHYRSVNNKALYNYRNASVATKEAIDNQYDYIKNYSFEDLSSINFNDKDVSKMEEQFVALANALEITEDEYEMFVEYLKDNDYIQIDTASAVENVEELQNYLSEGDYEKVVELVGKDNASGVVNFWNTLSANDKFAELSAEDKATMLIETWNEATPEEKTVILKGGEQAEQTIASILGRTSENATTIELDSGQVIAATEEALGLKTTLEEATKPNYKVKISSNPLSSLLKYAKDLITYLQNLTAKPYNVIVNTTYKTTGTKPSTSNSNSSPKKDKKKEGTQANGTVNGFASGTISAHANGTKITIQKDETALMNELGNEGIVRGGKLYEVNGGAQKVHLKRGDIVFNHKQMTELKKNGYVTSNGGRGRIIGAYANGTTTKTTTKNKNKTTTTNYSNEKNSSDNLFNWIERRIKKFQTKFDRWLNQAETALTSNFVSKYYEYAANNQKKLMATEASAYSYYMKKASGVKFTKRGKELRDKVTNGKISIENISDEKLKTSIEKYQEYYDQAQEALDAFIESAKTFYDIPLEKAAKNIELLSNSIDLLDLKIENAIGSSAKNKLLNSKKAKSDSQLKEYETASNSAQKNLETAGNTLKSTKKGHFTKDNGLKDNANKQKVINAVNNNKEVNLAYFKEGSELYKEAVKYNEALKAQKQAQNDVNTAEQENIKLNREIQKQKFDNIADNYSKKVEMLEHGTTYLENRIAEIEASGQKAHIGYYNEESKINDQKKKQFEAEKVALEKQLKEIPKGTDEWYEAYAQLRDVSTEISNCTQKTYELNNAINQAHFDLFENIHNEIDRLMDEQDFLRTMMSHEKTFDENTGEYTKAGLANLASLTSDVYSSQEKASRSKSMVETLTKMVNSGQLVGNGFKFNSMDELKEKLKEYYDQWRSDIEATQAAEEAIYNAEKDHMQSRLDAMKELIDEKKEALSIEKDLYDYSNQISDKTKNIATLEKQLALYRNDTSEEGRAKAQKLQSELNDAQKDLRDTEYDRYISDQQDMLDDLYEEYEELINKKLDDFKKVVQEGMANAESNATTANDYLEKLKDNIGYKSENQIALEQNGIKSAISEAASRIENAIRQSSGTEGSTPKDAGTNNITNPNTQTSSSKNNSNNSNTNTGNSTNNNTSKSNSDLLKTAKDYINKYASKPKKNSKNDYKYVNQKIWDYTKGKVLSDSELKTLASKLKVKYNNSSKTGNLAKKLHDIGFKGFSSGGKVVEVDDINKMIRANGDDGIASVRKGEAILTPIQSKQFELFASRLKEMNGLMDYSSAVMDMQDEWQNAMREVGDLSKSSMFNHSSVVGDVHLHATFPNVTDASKAEDMIRAIQDNQKLQKTLQSVTIDQLNGAGRLSSRRIK